MARSVRPRVLRLIGVLAAFLLLPATAQADSHVSSYDFASPLFGLDTRAGGRLVVADGGAGVVQLNREGGGRLLAELPGITDVDPFGFHRKYAVTGAPASAVYKVVGGTVRQIADIATFEEEVNPDGRHIDSNAFDVHVLPGGRKMLVADAAGNSLLWVRADGEVDWIATFPKEKVSTANAKEIAGCPNPPEDLAFVCGLPDEVRAEAVSTSVTVGADGAYYVGELKGFPAPVGESRIWRIEPGTQHADCKTSPACSVVADGFTSIVDLNRGPEGSVLVTELDEASFLAAEFGVGLGGTVSMCHLPDDDCEVVASELREPTASTWARGHVFSTVRSLDPDKARVKRIA